ncbi:hypothetical protein Tco_0015327 [Tanacetum coccineum]
MLQTGLVHGKRNTKGVNQASKAGFKLPKGKPKLIYRPMAKLNNSKQHDNTPKENVNVACDKPNDYPIMNCGNSSSPTNDNNKSKYTQDDIDLGQLRRFIDKRMEEDNVLDINTDATNYVINIDNVMHDVGDTNVVLTNNSKAPAEVKGSDKGSMLEQFLKSREESRNKHQSSVSDSDKSEVEEVLITEPIPGGGFLDCLVDDLDGYDGYEAQFYDLSEQGRAFYDRYDIRLNSRCRK